MFLDTYIFLSYWLLAPSCSRPVADQSAQHKAFGRASDGPSEKARRHVALHHGTRALKTRAQRCRRTDFHSSTVLLRPSTSSKNVSIQEPLQYCAGRNEELSGAYHRLTVKQRADAAVRENAGSVSAKLQTWRSYASAAPTAGFAGHKGPNVSGFTRYITHAV